jgi:hypothetical protein
VTEKATIQRRVGSCVSVCVKPTKAMVARVYMKQSIKYNKEKKLICGMSMTEKMIEKAERERERRARITRARDRCVELNASNKEAVRDESLER